MDRTLSAIGVFLYFVVSPLQACGDLVRQARPSLLLLSYPCCGNVHFIFAPVYADAVSENDPSLVLLQSAVC